MVLRMGYQCFGVQLSAVSFPLQLSELTAES
jgi:hypothetical protein